MDTGTKLSDLDLRRWIPALNWLRTYDTSWLRGDLIAGLTLAAYLLPAGLGDASLANLPPQAGLYACLFSGLVFWLFCSSRHTAISVTSAISLLVGASLSDIAGGDASRFGALAAGTAILVAIIAFIAWAVRAGAIVNFISESVMVGFKCGVALYLASTQLPKLFGIHGAHGDFWENSGNFIKHLGETNSASLGVGLAALVALVLGKVLLPNKPIALFVVVGGIIASALLGLDAKGVKLLGEVPQGLPAIGLPQVYWSDFNALLPLALRMLPARRSRNGCHRPHVRRETWRSARRQSGVPGACCLQSHRGIGARLPSQRRHVPVTGQRRQRRPYAAVRRVLSLVHSVGHPLPVGSAERPTAAGSGGRRPDGRRWPVPGRGAAAPVAGQPPGLCRGDGVADRRAGLRLAARRHDRRHHLSWCSSCTAPLSRTWRCSVVSQAHAAFRIWSVIRITRRSLAL